MRESYRVYEFRQYVDGTTIYESLAEELFTIQGVVGVLWDEVGSDWFEASKAMSPYNDWLVLVVRDDTSYTCMNVRDFKLYMEGKRDVRSFCYEIL